MEDIREQIFEYADRLYAKALHEMESERFRIVDMYALSAHGAAVYLATDQNSPGDLRRRAGQLEEAAWALSRRAYRALRGEQRRKLMEPRMSGDHDETEDIRMEMRAVARMVSER